MQSLNALAADPDPDPELLQRMEQDLVLSQAQASSKWAITEIKMANSDMGAWPSIAIHPLTGLPWVTFYDATYKSPVYARQISNTNGNCGLANTWICSAFAPQVTLNQPVSSIAFDADGDYLMAFDAGNGYLYVVYTQNNAFQTKWVYDSFHSGGAQYVSAKFGLDGKPRLASRSWWHLVDNKTNYRANYWFLDNNQDFISRYSYDSSENKSNDTSTGAYISMDINYLDNPAMAYRVNGGALYKDALGFSGFSNNGDCGAYNNWRCMLVDTSQGSGSYIDLHLPKCQNCNDEIRIAYLAAQSGAVRIARYNAAWNTHCGGSSGWLCATIDSAGGGEAMGVSLAVDYSISGYAVPAVAYYDNNDPGYTHGVLKFARYVGKNNGNCGASPDTNAWQCEVVDDGGPGKNKVGQTVSMAYSADGRAYLAYYDATNKSLKIAYERFTGPWVQKSYTPNSLKKQEWSTMIYVIHSSGNAALTGVRFNEFLYPFDDADLNTWTSTCDGSLSLVQGIYGLKVLKYEHGVILPNTPCSITVKVRAGVQGNHQDAASVVISDQAHDGGGSPANVTILADIFLPIMIR